MRTKTLAVCAVALSSFVATSAFAIKDGRYAQAGIGAAFVDANVDGTTFHSDALLHLKGGVGYRAHFSKTTPLFWGADAQINYYNKNGNFTTADAGLMVGGDLSKFISLYIKGGGEYFFKGSDLRPKLAIGLNYCVDRNTTINLESAATVLKSDRDADVFLSSLSLGLQYNF